VRESDSAVDVDVDLSERLCNDERHQGCRSNSDVLCSAKDGVREDSHERGVQPVNRRQSGKIGVRDG
jgi:hypothetical protein